LSLGFRDFLEASDCLDNLARTGRPAQFLQSLKDWVEELNEL
jgi:hypothetical protein